MFLLNYNRSNLFSNDMLFNYMLHLDIHDIKSLSLIDKKAFTLYNDKYLWTIKINTCLQQFTGKYLGEYSSSEYQRVKFAMDNANVLCYTQFYLTNEDLEIIFTLDCFYHDYEYYQQNILIIPDEDIKLICYTNQHVIANFANIEYNIPYKNKKRLIFNIFYYFPYVKWTSM